jgi:hypothetical protein
MKTSMGLALIGIGAIFAFAVTTNTSVFNLHTAGWVIMFVGVLGLALPRRGYQWVGRRLLLRQFRWNPRRRVQDVTYPTYETRNPAHTRVLAGLPAPDGPGGAGGTRPPGTPPEAPTGETEVVEDVYEQ